jgi:hypothetical protein
MFDFFMCIVLPFIYTGFRMFEPVANSASPRPHPFFPEYIVAPNQIDICTLFDCRSRILLLTALTCIDEVLGCQLPVFISWPALVLYNLPPLIMAVTTFTYGGEF